MKPITATLALSQLRQNRKRTILTIVGIMLSVAMITAVFGFAASGIEALRGLVGDDHVHSYSSIFIWMSAIFGSIIIIASVIVISNAFRISASERLRQFGILKSVGATRRQILKIVLYEGIYLSLIAIPAGIIVGLLVEWLGTSIGDTLLAPMNKLLTNTEGVIRMQFIFNLPSILLALCLSFFTIMLSAFFPARTAAKVPAIEAIRLTRDIRNDKNRKPRTHKLSRLLFGFEGTLAAKSIRRSKRSYRAMVTALTISIVLFLVCGGLDSQMTMTMNQAYMNIDADSVVYLTSKEQTLLPQTDELTEKLAAYPDTQLYTLRVDKRYHLPVDDPSITSVLQTAMNKDGMPTSLRVALVTPDAEHYAELCRLAGVPVGSTILINSTRQLVEGKSVEFQPLTYSGQTLTLDGPEQTLSLSLDAQLTGAQLPQEIAYLSNYPVTIVVADASPNQFLWFAKTPDSEAFSKYAWELLQSYADADTAKTGQYSYSAEDITSITDMTRSLTKLITIFLYGFVGMLSLIGLTSVISAISANVQLRAREFAVLKSVGMTERSIRRMLALESVMSALKSLLYGLPLGSAAMYLTYTALTQQDGFQFVYPLSLPLEAIAGVFVIALITTQYAAGKLRGGSIIDTIRMGDGV